MKNQILNNKFSQAKYSRGYTLLFAVLVSSTVLSIGISILTISKKEFLLASSARESTVAFYAADSGLECATYYDQYASVYFPYTGSPTGSINCGKSNTSQSKSVGLNDVTYTFDINLDTSETNTSRNTPCAVVKVYKDSGGKTDIESRGYNSGWNSVTNKCDVPSPKRVERALHYFYQIEV